jgi:hypothetical protein
MYRFLHFWDQVRGLFVQIPQNANYTIKNDKKDVLHAIMRKLSQIVADHHEEFGKGYEIPGKVAKSSVEYFCNLQQCLAYRDDYVRLREIV